MIVLMEAYDEQRQRPLSIESRSRQIECGTFSRRILADSKSTLLASTAKQRLKRRLSQGCAAWLRKRGAGFKIGYTLNRGTLFSALALPFGCGRHAPSEPRMQTFQILAAPPGRREQLLRRSRQG